MNKLLILPLLLISFLCSAQSPKKESKLDSIKLNQWEEAQFRNYLQGDKAKEINQLKERISFLQRELQLLNEGQQNLLESIRARESKQGMPIDFRNGYLILQNK